MTCSAPRRRGFSYVELMAVVAIVGIVAAVIVPRLTGGGGEARKAACAALCGNIEIQAQVWRHNTGAFPATDLSDLGGDPAYFPEGAPTCPVNGSVYTINPAGRVIGHVH